MRYFLPQVLLLGLLLAWPVQAESLFQAGATYTAQPSMVPRSLFTRPLPRYVGDMLTVTVNETTRQQTQFDYRIEDERTVNNTGINVLNNAVGMIFNKLPGSNNLASRAIDLLRLPSPNGIDDSNSLNNRATINRTNRVEEQITCQVVEVLPNGHLVIQGRKTMLVAKEQTDLHLTGIVNPFFIDSSNSIPSTQVANLQFMMGGKGVISRTQNDGLLTKALQYLR